MIDAMNFFQSLFSLNNFAPGERIALPERKLIRALVKDAKKLVEEAESQARHGETAQNLMREAKNISDAPLQQNMTAISVWHFEASLQKYNKAVARYDEAGRIQTQNSRIFFAEARTLAKRADEIERILESLNDSLTQK